MNPMKNIFIFIIIFITFCACANPEQTAKLQKSLEEANQKIEQLSGELNQAKTDLKKANDTIEELKRTPEQAYKLLVEKSADLQNVGQSEQLLKALDDFISKNPGSKQTVGAKSLKRTVTKKHDELKKEAERKAAEQAIQEFREKLKAVQDGKELDEDLNKSIADLITRSYTLSTLKLLPQTKYREAEKSPETERGKLMKYRGQLMQIKNINDNLCEGTIIQNGWDVVFFYAVGSTKGLYANSWGTFYGIFTQQYSYQNTGGGTTHALVLVGYFDITENRQ